LKSLHIKSGLQLLQNVGELCTIIRILSRVLAYHSRRATKVEELVDRATGSAKAGTSSQRKTKPAPQSEYSVKAIA
jgi:hypothetical protein